MWVLDDVIAAVASAPGSGPRGIVRVCGPDVQSIVSGILGGPGGAELHPGRASRFETALEIQGLATPLPAALYVWPDHRSYSGQPTVEIYTIGSPPSPYAIIDTLVLDGARR